MSRDGFSLLELLVAIAIIAVLFSLGVPAFYYHISRNRSNVAVRNIVAALNYVRSEAIKTGGDVKFCRSVDGVNCGGGWSDGQIVVDRGGKVLRVFPAVTSSDELVWRGGFGKNDALVFNSLGGLKSGSGSFLLTSHDKSDQERKVVISQTGRIRVSVVI